MVLSQQEMTHRETPAFVIWGVAEWSLDRQCKYCVGACFKSELHMLKITLRATLTLCRGQVEPN